MLVMVLLPLIIGIGARYTLGAQRIRLVQPVLPMISALLLYALALGLVAKAQPAIARNLDWVPIIAIVTSILTIINLAVGYLLARLLRLDESNSRAIMFDVGIYNSGLGAVLASLNFGAFAALPALMNAMLNMVIGSMLASYLGSKPLDQEQSDSAVSRPVTSQLGAE